MNDSYLDTIYNEKRTPKTNYPYQLARHLSHRFSFRESGKLLELGCGRGNFLLAFKSPLCNNSLASPGIRITAFGLFFKRKLISPLNFKFLFFPPAIKIKF